MTVTGDGAHTKFRAFATFGCLALTFQRTDIIVVPAIEVAAFTAALSGPMIVLPKSL